MTADPTAPWAPGEHELRGLRHTSWPSRSHPCNAEVCEEQDVSAGKDLRRATVT